MSDGEKRTPEADTGGSTRRAETGPSLPANSVLHIMRHAMGGEQEAITQEAVDAVQRCAGEFISFVVSEARARAPREDRVSISYADIMGVLGTLGFRHVPLAPTRPCAAMRGHARPCAARTSLARVWCPAMPQTVARTTCARRAESARPAQLPRIAAHHVPAGDAQHAQQLRGRAHAARRARSQVCETSVKTK